MYRPWRWWRPVSSVEWRDVGGGHGRHDKAHCPCERRAVRSRQRAEDPSQAGTGAAINGNKGDILLFVVRRRPAARAQARFQAQPNRRPCRPALAAERRPAQHAAPQRSQLLRRLRAVHVSRPALRPMHRSLAQPRRPLRTHPRRQARPAPILRRTHQTGPQGIPLHIAQNREQVLVLLDGERLEPPLPDVTAGAMMKMITPYVGGHQPLHPAGKIAIAARPQDQVKVIGHQAPGQHPHGHALAGRLEEINERLVVAILAEDPGATVAAVGHVIADATDGRSGGSRHGRMLRTRRRCVKRSEETERPQPHSLATAPQKKQNVPNGTEWQNEPAAPCTTSNKCCHQQTTRI